MWKLSRSEVAERPRAFAFSRLIREWKKKLQVHYISPPPMHNNWCDEKADKKKASRRIEWEWESINPQKNETWNEKKSWMECIILDWASASNWEINQNGHMPQRVIDSIKNHNRINHRCRTFFFVLRTVKSQKFPFRDFALLSRRARKARHELYSWLTRWSLASRLLTIAWLGIDLIRFKIPEQSNRVIFRPDHNQLCER